MAWNEPGNNNKRRDPWQDGENRDLDEAMKQMKDRLGRFFGGGKGGGFPGPLLIVLGVALMGAVLLQQRKTGGFSGAFGGGTQADMSGGQWQRFTTLTKLSIILIALFLVNSLLIVVVFR